MTRIDYVAQPPTSFPFRDLLVLERLGVGPDDDVCEIGVGSGATTARLARLCASITGFEISAPTLDALRYLERRHANLRFVVADVTAPDALVPYAGAFTTLVSCDTLEHVVDPAAFFRAVATLLRPGGKLLVTFPNEPRERMHGITRFDRAADLRALVEGAGLVDVEIAVTRLAPAPARVADSLGWKPLALARRVLHRAPAPGEAAAAPQKFDETRFFQRMRRLRPLAPGINLYWWGVLRAMDAFGPCFEVDASPDEATFRDAQVLVTGHRGA